MRTADLVVASVDVTPVLVPITPPVQTSAGSVGVAPLVLVDLHTRQGITGSSYVFCYTPVTLAAVTSLVRELSNRLIGVPIAPRANLASLEGVVRLVGTEGLVAMSLAGIEMALWDVLAKSAGRSLVTMLGGMPRQVRAYCSLRASSPNQITDETAGAIASGFHAVKIRLGHPRAEHDDVITRAVIDAFERAHRDGTDAENEPPSYRVMVDYNQALAPDGPVGAARRLRRIVEIAGKHLEWIEEPLAAQDDVGHAMLSKMIDVPIQLGENWWGSEGAARAMRAGAGHLAMLDVMKIGGVSGWVRASAIAHAAGRPVSSHLFPEISVHLLAASDNPDWLEVLDLAGPVMAGRTTIADGMVSPSDEPGCGIRFDRDAVSEYRVT
jgi:mandelate racemase